MTKHTSNKVALVTGGNKGIGFAICQGLLKAGFEVIVAGHSLEGAKEATEKLQSNGAQVRAIELDVADDASIDRAVKNLTQEINALDVLVNNAGIYPDEGVDILTVSRELLEQTMNTNAFSPIRTIQAVK